MHLPAQSPLAIRPMLGAQHDSLYAMMAGLVRCFTKVTLKVVTSLNRDPEYPKDWR
jgi:hypothetical protein